MLFSRIPSVITTSRFRNALPVVGLGAAVLIASCGGGDTQEITETRTVTTSQGAPPLTGTMPATMATPTPAAAYTWTAPDSWEELPATSTRMANFKVDSATDAECYLTVLSGTGGGVEANVNRWRAQLSLEPYSPAEVAELPTLEVLGQDALLVEFEGTYTGMGGAENEAGYKLLGLILEDQGNAVFVKMTGPVEVVDREKDNFIAFCQSLEPAPAQTTMQLPEGHPEIGPGNMPATAQAEMQLPDGHPEIGDVQGLAPGTRDNTSVVQSWDAPDTWTQAPDKPMRIVTFTMGESGESECYVTSLSGPAGGVEANVNRWRRQMGKPPLDGPALAELPTVTVLGKPSPMIEITGDFSGMDGVGAICPLETETLFVKMTGPANEIQANKEQFVAFCESLK